MKKIFLLTFLIIVGAIVLVGCSKKTEMSAQYKSNNESFKQSIILLIILLNEARDLSNPPGSEKQPSFELSKEIEEKIFSNTEEGIRLGKQVSDDYLDFLHPELKSMFKNKLIKGTEIYYDGFMKMKNNSGNIIEGVQKQIQGNQLIIEWLNWWIKYWEEIEEFGENLLQRNPLLVHHLIQNISGAKTHFKKNEPQMDHIFPRSTLRERGFNEAEINHFANFWILEKHKNQNKTNQHPQTYFKDVRDSVLSRVFIKRELLNYRRYRTFIKERSQDIINYLRKKLRYKERDFISAEE